MDEADLRKILSMLESQAFADWYVEGRFDSYVTGSDEPVTKQEILSDLQSMLK